MELTEETLKTIERLSQNGWQADAETVRALVAEIERQRAEIAVLRSVINDIERAVINETVNPPKLQSWIVHRIHEGVAALDTKSDDAPVETADGVVRKFKVGDRVIANSHAIEGMRGTIVDVAPGVNRIAPYRVHIDNMSYNFQLKEAEIELAND